MPYPIEDQMPVKFGCFRLQPENSRQSEIITLVIRQFDPQDQRWPKDIEGFFKRFDNANALYAKVAEAGLARDAEASILRMAKNADEEPNAAHFDGDMFFWLRREQILGLGFDLFVRAYWPR